MVSPEQIEKNIVASFDLVKQDVLKLWAALEKLKDKNISKKKTVKGRKR
jgi:hypothetical protein